MALPGFVLLLLSIATWVVPLWPEFTVEIQTILAGIGCALILTSRVTKSQLGVRVDNLLPACAVFLAVTAGLIAPAMIWTRSGAAWPFPPDELPRYFLWALFQQFVAVGAFWFPFRRATGLPVEEAASFSREMAVATAAALVFAVAHAPNPGLMVLGGVAELVWLSLFGRFRNLFALSLAHGFAALVVSHHLVPSPWLTSMRVGLSYWEP